MGKVLQFRRVKQEVKGSNFRMIALDGLDDDVSSIVNDYSLTPANRHWLLENMLMNVDDQLERYKKELEQAERKLDKVVQAAEEEIAAAYSEFTSRVGGLTKAVRRLTQNSSRQNRSDDSANIATNSQEPQFGPQ